MNNTAKIKKDDDFNFSNNKDNPKRGNKREKKPYNKKNDDENEKIQIFKLDKYYKKRKKFKP